MSSSRPLTRRSVLAGLGGTALAAGLAACGRGGSGGTTGSLQFLLLGPTPALLTLFKDKLIPAFRKQEGIEVQLQTSDWGSGFQKVLTAAASHALPDVLTVGGIWTAPLVSKGALGRLDEHLKSWSARTSYYPGYLKDCQYKGHTYALPVYADVRTVAYRADLFERAGLDPDKPPTTWDEYRAYAEKLVRKKGGRIVTEGADWFIDTSIGLQQSFAQLMLQAGGTYYKPDGKANFASAEGLRALEYLVSFFADGLSSVDVVNKPTSPAPLVAGSAAMAFTNMSVLANAKANDAEVLPKIKAGPPLATRAGAKPVTSAWVNKFAMSATTKNPEGAWKWLAFVSEKANLGTLDAEYGFIPPRKDLAHAAFLHDVDTDFITASEHVVPQPPNPQMLEIAQVINTQLQRAVRRQAKPADVLETIDTKVDALTGA
ncbi:MAG TPA: extracellular solute-binding protein [Streptosporangiales bacterium]